MNTLPFASLNAQRLYDTAKNVLGTHQTLDSRIPSEVGCAEAVCRVLMSAGAPNIPFEGIPGTAALLAFFESNVCEFETIQAPEAGCIIISPTGHGNGKIPGHTGILGIKGAATPSDFGIMSNDSNSGLFLELWTLAKWYTYYGQYGGLPVKFFRLK